MLVSGDNRGKFEANLLYVESKSDFGTTAGKSFTAFFARGGVEFVDESKSLRIGQIIQPLNFICPLR